MSRFRSSLFLSFLTAPILIVLSSGAFAEALRLAPLNPEFLKYREEAAKPALDTAAAAGHPLGYQPGPLDLSHVRAPAPDFFETAAAPPHRYDLREQDAVTAVRDQVPYGTCWAHGALASLESTFRKAGKGTFDFSEWHLAYFAYVDESPSLPAFTPWPVRPGEDPVFDPGGHPWMSTALLARWTGTVDEADRPYQNAKPWPESARPKASDPVLKHLEQVLFLDNKDQPPADGKTIKKALMAHGAMAIRLLWDPRAFDPRENSYCNSLADGTGHIVTIIGWDDSFPAERFVVNPGQNGAWLVKNSWGTEWGDKGCFWLSYADPTISQTTLFIGSDATNFSRIYQYDPLGWIDSSGYGGDTAWFANAFTASGLGSETEALKAVSFYAGQAGASYHIEVYIGTAGHNPRGGILAAEFDGKLAAAGYHTIRLPEEVTLKGGDLFAVVVRLTTPGYGSPIPLEYPEAGYSDKATARAGQSFISQHGDDWTDLTAAVDNANVCLKAFTGPASINLDMPAGAGGGGCSTGTFSAFLLLALPLGLILTRHGA